MDRQRLQRWLALWDEVRPRAKRKPNRSDWEAAIERFIAALKRDLAGEPLSWWQRICLLHALQKELARRGVPGEALRPLVLAIILNVYLAGSR
ncbi:hypothetical protein [Pelomicrobium methylotrophicum]|uniref:Uncharacterized protein n=1 Tax=Pelomicrobium methylotrophicum TaxID=2602750 RepID=A0A5C7EX91_9PROT|nr:hypothetical protein [Pelomicrobium methylotrophicum]TXF13729.1 hypothetical protein FR698_01070 [Pelomicrobium methylotrophicum]